LERNAVSPICTPKVKVSKQDYTQSAFWYHKAAEQGNADAQFNLGRLYKKGHGVPQDDRQSAFGIRKAAEQGNAEAQYLHGMMYTLGDDVPQDYTQAAAWYRKAAEQGVAGGAIQARACRTKMVGGFPQDDAQAAFGIARRLSRAMAEAQFLLGLSYYFELGVPQDYAEAYFLLDLSDCWKAERIEHGTGCEVSRQNRVSLTPADQSRVNRGCGSGSRRIRR